MRYFDNIQMCFADLRRLRSPTALAALTDALIGDGFRLALFDTGLGTGADHEFQLWFAHHYNPADPEYQALSPEQQRQLMQPGMTPILEQAIRDFTANRIKELAIQALGVTSKTAELHFSMSVLSDIEETDAGIEHPVATRHESGESYWFERLPELLYTTLHPDFEYLRTEYDAVFGSNDLQQGALPYLYVDNYFGSALAAQIGRERLLTTPGASIRKLSDGGIFVRIERDVAAACRHLGLISHADARGENA
jgi:hypothetical protein